MKLGQAWARRVRDNNQEFADGWKAAQSSVYSVSAFMGGPGRKCVKTVFVIGAGPAGMFAAQKIAQSGHEVIILNRDIKPGGLAEYGIYPTKDKMKIGLRKQFAKVLSLPNVHYFGHVSVNEQAPVSIADLHQFSPSAMVFAIGAQGTKKLGLAGETALGVYAAKDFVYSYN